MFITVYRPNYRRICLCNEAKYQSYQSKERYRSHGPAQLQNGAIEGKKVGACLLLLGGGLLLLRGGLLLLRRSLLLLGGGLLLRGGLLLLRGGLLLDGLEGRARAGLEGDDRGGDEVAVRRTSGFLGG